MCLATVLKPQTVALSGVSKPCSAGPNRKRGRGLAYFLYFNVRILKNMKLFQSTVRLLPSETGCNKISQQDFAALADADMASQMLVLTFVFRTIWEQLLECDDESTQYDCFVFLSDCTATVCVCGLRNVCFLSTLSPRATVTWKHWKTKESYPLNSPIPFLQNAEEKTSCCVLLLCDDNQGMSLYLRLWNKEPHAKWVICNAHQRHTSCPKLSGLG